VGGDLHDRECHAIKRRWKRHRLELEAGSLRAPTVSGYTDTWTVNVSDFDAQGNSQSVSFEGEGYYPVTYTQPTTISQH